MEEERTYTQRAIARCSGITRNQLRAWERAGALLSVKQGGSRDRVYTRDQALGLIALGMLREAGLPDKALKRAAAMLPGLIPSAGYLLFDGRTVSAAADEKAAVEQQCKGRPLVPAYLIPIEEMGRRLRRCS